MAHNGWGGPRPNSGRKPMKVEHELLLRATQPKRFAQLEEAGELTAIQVMRANMEFFHYRAAEVLTTIIAMPLGDDVDATQLQALQDFAGVIKMRELASSAPATWRATRTPRWRQSLPARPQAPANHKQSSTSRRRKRSAMHSPRPPLA